MSSRKQRVRYQLDSGGITHLDFQEIKAILRAADELIATGGRTILAKILKGSRDKKLLEYGLDQCPAYGFYRQLTLEEITCRIDYLILNVGHVLTNEAIIEHVWGPEGGDRDMLRQLVHRLRGKIAQATPAEHEELLEIAYSFRLPVIYFTQKGWEIEKETYTEELLQKLTVLLKEKDFSFVAELKDRNRGMILLLIEKIRKKKNPDFIPLLQAWQEIDYKKVRAALQEVIDELT